MSDFFDLMIVPFTACLVLTGIHSYVGFHVLERGVIFVDLALAQIAALGATVGFLLGYDLHSNGSYFISLGFTLGGALVFSLTRTRREAIPQEAFIGISYAVAAAAAVLILSRAADGGEELKGLLVGHLLFVSWHEVFYIFGMYSLVGIFHFIFRKRFFLISCSPHDAFESGVSIRLWDFLFYASFGLVVTSSVELAGVLLVFSFLIAPAVCGKLLAQGTKSRLAIGWGVGFGASIIGISLSYFFDLPTGATIVCVFGALVLVSILFPPCFCVRET